MLRFSIRSPALASWLVVVSLALANVWADDPHANNGGQSATSPASKSAAPGGSVTDGQPPAERKEGEPKAAEPKEGEHKQADPKEAEHKTAGSERAGNAAAAHEPASGHGGAHHDPFDLSHQNATHAIEDPSQWKGDLAIASFIVFLCLLALLSKFAWRPVMNGLEARERGIAAKIDEAKHSADQAAAQLRQYEAKLATASEEARVLVDQARRDAETAKERILAEAKSVAERERQRAVEDINTAKNAALQEMTQKSVELAVSLAGRLIRKQLKPDDHAQLIREAVEQFPSRN